MKLLNRVTAQRLGNENELLPIHLYYKTSSSSIKIFMSSYAQFYLWLRFLHLAPRSKKGGSDL